MLHEDSGVVSGAVSTDYKIAIALRNLQYYVV
jgi:hypothetical protein